MTIDEAIKHCEDVAYQYEKVMKRYDDASGYNRSHNEKIRTNGAKGCEQLISLYRQLAEWLRELVHLRNITAYLRDFIDCFGSMDSMYYNEDIIKWAEEELRVEMREVNADE